MINLELLPRKVFEITFEDGSKVQGQFGTWALKRFTDKKKISLQQVSDVFNNLSLGDAIDFILCAVEYKQREAGAPLLSDMKLCEWADMYADQQGSASGAEVLATLIMHSSSEEKKSEQKEVESGGENLPGTQPQPELQENASTIAQ
jgi:hypothetical protein